MEDEITDKVRKWLNEIAIAANSAFVKSWLDDASKIATTSTADDPGISISSSGGSTADAYKAEGYLDVDEEAIKKMYADVGAGRFLSSCISTSGDKIDTYEVADIKPVDGKLKIDDTDFDGDMTISTDGIKKLPKDWTIRDCSGIKIKDCSGIKITDYRPTNSFDDPITRAGIRFNEAANSSPEPKKTKTVKDTEITRLWNKLDNI